VERTWESEKQKRQRDLGTGFRSSWGNFTGCPGSFPSPPSPHKERHDARRGRKSHARMLCRVGGGMQKPCALLSFECHPCLTPGVYIREAASISVMPPGRGVCQVRRRGTRAQDENEHDHTVSKPGCPAASKLPRRGDFFAFEQSISYSWAGW
jgi:hypothetical protein